MMTALMWIFHLALFLAVLSVFVALKLWVLPWED